MKDLIIRIICSALNNVFSGQPNLSKFIPQETAEREPNLSFHFANELWKFLFWLDCDFDVTKSFHHDKRPDMIFHRRGINALNFLVVEVKRKSNPNGFADDLVKIRDHWFDDDLHYQFGASVVIDENTGDYTLRLMERGSIEPIKPVTKDSFNSRLDIADISFEGRKMLKAKVAAIIHSEEAKANSTDLVTDLNLSICAVYARKWSVDDIVIGATAKAWLAKKELLPSTWGLLPPQVDFIKRAGIRLTMMYSPASELTLRPNPLEDVAAGSLVIFDADTLGHEKLNKAERIATLLHEIGHVFYALTPKKPIPPTVYVTATNGESESENAADDFAYQLGYGKQIISSLETLAGIYPQTFGTPGIKARIERMKSKTATE
ncbi:MAG TPA: hypothetical protein VHG89_01950 [Verrucomicrobiae bacterium]|nr:hypothetical protein [Verrucomicrobiae bacterium]